MQVPDEGFLPQFRSYITESDDGDTPQVGMTCFTINPSSEKNARASEYCFGEQILSFRSLIKRYSTTVAKSVTSSSSAHVWISFMFNLIRPASPGYTVAKTNANPTIMQALNYAYLGVRGGTRHRFRWVDDATAFAPMRCMRAMLQLPNGALTEDYGTAHTSNDFQIQYRGSAMFLPQTNAGVEVEFPFYSPNLFQISFNDLLGTGSTDNDLIPYFCSQYLIGMDHSALTALGHIEELAAAAEDFSFIRYQGCPYWTFS